MISNQTMSSKDFFKKDYILIIIVSILYFLMMKNSIHPFTHLIVAILVGLYFFPLKLFIRQNFSEYSKSNKVMAELSYFVISNVISLTALSSFLDPEGGIHNVIYIYGIINLIFLIYFHSTKKMTYNLILTCCTTLLVAFAITL